MLSLNLLFLVQQTNNLELNDLSYCLRHPVNSLFENL